MSFLPFTFFALKHSNTHLNNGKGRGFAFSWWDKKINLSNQA